MAARAPARRAIAAEERAALIALFEGMERIRQVEQRLSALFADNEVPGFIHLSIGQEGVPVGVMAALLPRDTIASNHRGHGHAIAKGADLDRFFAEILARETGYCRGRGGSMHVADAAAGMLGANGIVGAGLSLAAGSALAHQIRGTGGIAAVFFGDGALCEGLLHETLNLAALWKLPLLFVCENNGWSEFTPTAREFVGDVEKLAGAYSVPAVTVDSVDVVAVRDAARGLAEAARNGGGPQFLQCMTRRTGGHFEGDAQPYRDKADIAEAQRHDPLRAIEPRLHAAGVGAAEIAAARSALSAQVDAAVEAARRAPRADFAAAFADVYADMPGRAHG